MSDDGTSFQGRRASRHKEKGNQRWLSGTKSLLRMPV